jgi:predicted nucleotidyltransferase
MTEFEKIARVLAAGRVKFIVIGGWAAIFHGLAHSTYDVDVVYSRDRENIRRLVEALKPLHPYLRGAPPGLPFVFDEKTVRNGLNFTLNTDLGKLDLLGEVPGARSYDELLPHSKEMEANGIKYQCATLERLIQMKRAAGRPKDFEILAALVALLEERRKMERGESS